MFMCLCREGWLLVRPSPVSVRDLEKAEEEIKAFLEAFYRNVYRGDLKRVRLCRLVFAALLDLVSNGRQCGPVWSFWQFPMERFIGTLPKLIGSRSHPYQSLMNSITEQHQSELIAAYAARMCPGQWAAATGESNGAGDDCCEDHDVTACYAGAVSAGGERGNGGVGRRWRLSIRSPQVVVVVMLHPVTRVIALSDEELAALQRHDFRLTLGATSTRKCFRAELQGGAIVDARDGDVHESIAVRRTSLVHVQSSDQRELRSGRVETIDIPTYGLIKLFLLCEGPVGATTLAYVRRVCSRRDPTGGYGIPDRVRGMHVFTDYGGRHEYIDVMTIVDSVGCLTRDKRHHVLHTREPFIDSLDDNSE